VTPEGRQRRKSRCSALNNAAGFGDQQVESSRAHVWAEDRLPRCRNHLPACWWSRRVSRARSKSRPLAAWRGNGRRADRAVAVRDPFGVPGRDPVLATALCPEGPWVGFHRRNERLRPLPTAPSRPYRSRSPWHSTASPTQRVELASRDAIPFRRLADLRAASRGSSSTKPLGRRLSVGARSTRTRHRPTGVLAMVGGPQGELVR
jgi:hypothetical protein